MNLGPSTVGECSLGLKSEVSTPMVLVFLLGFNVLRRSDCCSSFFFNPGAGTFFGCNGYLVMERSLLITCFCAYKTLLLALSFDFERDPDRLDLLALLSCSCMNLCLSCKK